MAGPHLANCDERLSGLDSRLERLSRYVVTTRAVSRNAAGEPTEGATFSERSERDGLSPSVHPRAWRSIRAPSVSACRSERGRICARSTLDGASTLGERVLWLSGRLAVGVWRPPGAAAAQRGRPPRALSEHTRSRREGGWSRRERAARPVWVSLVRLRLRPREGNEGAGWAIPRRGRQVRSRRLAIAPGGAMRERRAPPGKPEHTLQPLPARRGTHGPGGPEGRRHARTELAPPARDAATPPRRPRAQRSTASAWRASSRYLAGPRRRPEGGSGGAGLTSGRALTDRGNMKRTHTHGPEISGNQA